MLSEAIHSLVDTGNQAILILGLKQASGVPDKSTNMDTHVLHTLDRSSTRLAYSG
uniref:Uncharacterized protein n=1 Tax=Peronospora matthiolae TaxID=2874970 RepID=A0AAV1UJU3_9STRA